MRILLYTGKGGVGKTSVAAATACKIASEGKRVLIMSTDQAHSLGDSFQCKLGNEPTLIMENLYGLEIDAIEECENTWGEIKKYFKRLLTVNGKDDIEVEELLVFPGFEELTSLFKMKEIYDQGEYDVLIVDCAPTGETLSLLKFPEMFGKWIDKLLPIKRKAVKVAGPMVEKVAKVPMPKDEVFDEVERLCDKMDALKNLMSDKEVLSIRIVTTPERIVIKEAKRNFAYLHLFNYNVDAIVVNKVYPECSLQGYFHKWAETQKTALQDVEESFRGLPVFRLELQKKELCGVEALMDIASNLYGEAQPENVLFQDTIFSVRKEENNTIFSIHIPFFDLKEMELYQQGDEMTIIINNERRTFLLPDRLKSLDITGAKYEDGMLNVRFA